MTANEMRPNKIVKTRKKLPLISCILHKKILII